MTSNGKRIKNAQKPAINDHILLKGHNANYTDFPIPLNESNVFKLHLTESLLIKKIYQNSIEIALSLSPRAF